MCDKKGASPTGGACLIMIDNFVVACDLAETVRDHAPGVTVIVARDLAEAMAALAGVDRVTVAFVEAGPAAFVRSPLAALVAERGGRVVLLGDAAEEEPDPTARWTVLRRPFSSALVVGLLTGLAAR